MNPMKDLGKVATLIEEAFAHDLDRAGQNALQELRWLSRFKPLLWWMLLINFDRTDFLSGFVWEEDGQIVGNVTINQMGMGARRWLISNVAVAEEYRGRGIATIMMDASEELVRECNGTAILLQVRADNNPARLLYQARQFKEIAGTTHLRLNQPISVATTPLPSGLLIRHRRYNSADTRRIYHLAQATTPASVQQEWPLRQSQFWVATQDRIANFLYQFIDLPPVYWVVEDNRKNLVALVNIETSLLRHPHSIELIIHPNWRGQLEPSLISRALNYLHRSPHKPITVKQPIDHPEAIAVYKSLGFEEEQTLLWMKRAI